MSDEQPTVQNSGGVLKYVLLAVGVLYIAGSMYMIMGMRDRIAALEQASLRQEAVNEKVQEKLHITNRSIEEAAQALGSKVGMTQEELNRRTAELQRQQKASETRLTAEQQKAAEAIQGVSGEVAGVKTELGGAKTDIHTTRTDLEATKAKLEKAIGDLGVQSGLIARNHDELELLKHKGDRNYYEFTLRKGQRAPVGTISLQLKKADQKKSRFTLNVIADDRTIEKKDRTMNEPMQFYTGRDRSLFEIVVYQVSKDAVTGYMSTPK